MRAYLLFGLVLLFSPVFHAQSDSNPKSPSTDQEKAPPAAAESNVNSVQTDQPSQGKTRENEAPGDAAPDKVPQQKEKSAAQDKDKIYESGKNGVTRPIPVRTDVPEMPEQLRRAHMNDDRGDKTKRFMGTVVLAGYLDKHGRPHDLKVLRSLSKEADKAALDSVKNWKFRPCTLESKPVNCHFAAEISFDLR